MYSLGRCRFKSGARSRQYRLTSASHCPLHGMRLISPRLCAAFTDRNAFWTRRQRSSGRPVEVNRGLIQFAPARPRPGHRKDYSLTDAIRL